jgi:hypothetical protein
MGALVEARTREGTGWRLRVVHYHLATALPDALGAVYDAEDEAAGVFCDPMPCAPILEALVRRVWLHRLEAVDVAASAAQFRSAVKAREVEAEPHPALEQALTFAVQRPLASAFGFERRKVTADMAPLNAAAFALWGLRRHDAASDPGVVVI